jgi:hypothetical protein
VTRGDKLRARIAAELEAIAERYTMPSLMGRGAIDVIEGSGSDLDA